MHQFDPHYAQILARGSLLGTEVHYTEIPITIHGTKREGFFQRAREVPFTVVIPPGYFFVNENWGGDAGLTRVNWDDEVVMLRSRIGSGLPPRSSAAVIVGKKNPHTSNSNTVAVVSVDKTRAGGSVLESGTYRVQMPADYDPDLVTGEDILLDDGIVVLARLNPADRRGTYSNPENIPWEDILIDKNHAGIDVIETTNNRLVWSGSQFSPGRFADFTDRYVYPEHVVQVRDYKIEGPNDIVVDNQGQNGVFRILRSFGERENPPPSKPNTMLTNPTKEPALFVREGSIHGNKWRHLILVTDGRDTVIELKPALLSGWDVERIEVRQGRDAWPGMSQEEIVAWIERNRDDERITDPAQIKEAMALLAKYGAPYVRPRQNPGGWSEPKQQWVFKTKKEAEAFRDALKKDREIRLDGKVSLRRSLKEYRHGGSPDYSVFFKALGLTDTSAASGLAREMGGRKWGDREHLFVKQNPSAMLTYGTLPPREEFAAVVGPNLPFYAQLEGADADAAAEVGYAGERIDDPDELYELIENLIEELENGNEDAGDLASGIMTVSGFEWI